MVEFKAVGGHWAAVSVDAVSGGQVFMHVGVCVGGFEEFTESDLDLAVWATDQQLAQLSRPGATGPLSFVETKAITAIGDFTFANPTGGQPTVAQVTLLGEAVAYDISSQEPGSPLVA